MASDHEYNELTLELVNSMEIMLDAVTPGTGSLAFRLLCAELRKAIDEFRTGQQERRRIMEEDRNTGSEQRLTGAGTTPGRITINEGLSWLKTLRARHSELVTLRNENGV